MTNVSKETLFSKLSRIMLSILVVLSIYGLLRFTVLKPVFAGINSRVETMTLSTYRNGVNLSEIVIGKNGSSLDLRSNLIGDSSTLFLNGGTGIKTSNPRILAMRKFLLDYNSPMYPYSDVLVTEAEATGLDWRLVASISGVESAFGNLIPHNGTHNAWGWRGGPGGAYSEFVTWKEGIRTVTQRLAIGYGTSLTPFQIEPVYCPPCYANPAHAWANGVTKFMLELDFYLENLEKI